VVLGPEILDQCPPIPDQFHVKVDRRSAIIDICNSNYVNLWCSWKRMKKCENRLSQCQRFTPVICRPPHSKPLNQNRTRVHKNTRLKKKSIVTNSFKLWSTETRVILNVGDRYFKLVFPLAIQSFVLCLSHKTIWIIDVALRCIAASVAVIIRVHPCVSSMDIARVFTHHVMTYIRTNVVHSDDWRHVLMMNHLQNHSHIWIFYGLFVIILIVMVNVTS